MNAKILSVSGALVALLVTVSLAEHINSSASEDNSGSDNSYSNRSVSRQMSYLDTLYSNLQNMPSGGACDAFKAHADNIYNGGIPDNIKVVQLENIANKAIKYGCLR